MDALDAINVKLTPQMQIIPLPPLKTKLNRDLPLHVNQKLSYHWKLLHKCSVQGSKEFRLGISRSFISVVNEFSIDLPEIILRKFCPHCSSFLAAPFMEKYRLCAVSKDSKLNRKRPQSQRCKNDVVATCQTCKKVAFRSIGYPRPTGVRTVEREDTLTPSTGSKVMTLTPGNNPKPKSATKRFSFLDKLENVKTEKVGRLENANFIGFTESEKKGTFRSTAPIISSQSKKRPFDNVFNNKHSIFDGANKSAPSKIIITQSAPAAESQPVLSLDALERSNKKRRKSLQQQQQLSSEGLLDSAAPESGASLNSLQSIFSLSKK